MDKILFLLAAVPAALTSAAEIPASVADAISQGKFSVNVRLRHEHVTQSALRDADALTLRTRLGFTTARYAGWQLMVEGENVLPFDGSSYSQAGLNPGGSGRAVVADPEVSELNQLWLALTVGKTTATLGRQRLVLDNARFIGDVAWRQNQQTFDAFVLHDRSFAQTTLTYAYLDQVNRVFSRRHAQGRWDSASHVFNASYTGAPGGTVAAYAYLLDFRNSAATSTATYGASFTGAQKITEVTRFTYRLELATQSDYGASPLDYSTIYNTAEGGLAWRQGALALGHELLGSDRSVGFKTPLATLHAFNGWADLFLTTPAAGLRDVYLKATANLPQAVVLTAFYHRYEAAKGTADYGAEFDLMLTRKFGHHLIATVKFADFRRDTPAFPGVRKFWVQLEYGL